MVRKAAELAGLNLESGQTLAINFVGPVTIAQINKDFLRHEGLTDVISFDYRSDDFLPDGTAVEIFVCPDVAERASKTIRGSSYSREMALYIVHGILHAAGEDDISPVRRKKMRSKERKIIGALGKEFCFNQVFPSS